MANLDRPTHVFLPSEPLTDVGLKQSRKLLLRLRNGSVHTVRGSGLPTDEFCNFVMLIADSIRMGVWDETQREIAYQSYQRELMRTRKSTSTAPTAETDPEVGFGTAEVYGWLLHDVRQSNADQ